MGYIKEPAGVDFIVDSTPLSAKDRKKISEIIAYFKLTGKKMPLQKRVQQKRTVRKSIRVAVTNKTY